MVIINIVKDILANALLIVGAIAAAYIVELTRFQTIVVLIFLTMVIVFSHLFTYFLNIDILKNNVREIDTSINRFDASGNRFETSINKFEDSLYKLDNKFEDSLRKLDNHIYRDKGIITFEDVSKLINESQVIHAFNPLRDIETFDEAIKESIKKGCTRRFIVSGVDARHFEMYKKKKENELKEDGINIDCENLFRIASWGGSERSLIPFTVVISKAGKSLRVWLHPSLPTGSLETYKAFYIDDPALISYFQTWFAGLWEKLKKEKLEPM